MIMNGESGADLKGGGSDNAKSLPVHSPNSRQPKPRSEPGTPQLQVWLASRRYTNHTPLC